MAAHLLLTCSARLRLSSAADRLGLRNADCVVIEDSIVGLRAAKSAGMRCIVTYTLQTADEDFYGEGADAKLLDFATAGVAAASELFPEGASVPSGELLPKARDPK